MLKTKITIYVFVKKLRQKISIHLGKLNIKSVAHISMLEKGKNKTTI
jgi:hypothetical protein